MEKLINKKVNLTLVGLDGNAFCLMGAFSKQALIDGWTRDEVNMVLNECMKGDYSHLVSKLNSYCLGE